MPHPLAWVPAEQARHASTDSKPKGSNFPTGAEVRTLCGITVTADNTEFAWFWPTCTTCYATARERVDRAERCEQANSPLAALARRRIS